MKNLLSECLGTFALVLAVTGAIVLEGLVASPICGASMNAARSLAPALVSRHLNSVWVYLFAPALGALLAVAACRCVREESCCAAPPTEKSA